jgi:ribosomal silencing factor RsfS
MNNFIAHVFTYPGTLTADQDPYFILPFDATLIHVSGQCITQDAIIFVEDDSTRVTDALTVTAGTTPVEQNEIGDFVGDQYPLFKKGSVVHLDVAHGSNCEDLIVVLTFAL